MSTKTKRTYSLSPTTVAAVKYLVEKQHAAPSQDALVDQAIRDYARRLQDAEEARLWSQASADATFQQEAAELDTGFATDDQRAWDI